MVWAPPQVDSGKAGFFFSVMVGIAGGFVSSFSGGNTLVIFSIFRRLLITSLRFIWLVSLAFLSKVFQ